MRVRVVRAGAGPDGVELDLHPGTGAMASDEAGMYLRIELGNRDAGTLLWWIRLAYPGGVDTALLAHTCAGPSCENEPTKADLEGDVPRLWCDDCAPENVITTDDIAKPQERVATVAGVTFYLRSAYGLNSEEAAEAIRCHHYTIGSAGALGMTIEMVAVDIARRVLGGSVRAQLEARAKADAAEATA